MGLDGIWERSGLVRTRENGSKTKQVKSMEKTERKHGRDGR